LRRSKLCSSNEYEIARQFPADEIPEGCAECDLLRINGEVYACGYLSTHTGRYVNSVKSPVKKVRLRNRVTIDGGAIPAGTKLTVVERSSTGEGYWCKNPKRGNVRRPPLFIRNDEADEVGS